MPFIALHKDTKKRIDITLLDHPREMFKAGECLCQLCSSPMIVKAGLIKRAHFAHANSCTSPYGSHPESAEHREAKMYLKTQLPARFEDYKDVRLEYEVPIKEVKRIVDLLAIFPKGHRVAHEVQLASITNEQLEARTKDYERAGIDVIWWLGKSANSPANRDWCLRTFGEVFSINF
jgi:competence protein CoiA